MKCSHCGADVPEGFKFCNMCGELLPLLPSTRPAALSSRRAVSQTKWIMLIGVLFLAVLTVACVVIILLAQFIATIQTNKNLSVVQSTPMASTTPTNMVPQTVESKIATPTLVPSPVPSSRPAVTIRPTRLLATSTPQPAGHSSSNPVRLGQSVLWTGRTGEQVKLTAIEFYRGQEAWQRIKAANQFNESPPSGWEYFLFRVHADFVRAGNDLSLMMAESAFVLISSTGREFQSFEGPTIVPPDPPFLKKVYVGGSVDGWMAFSALAGDSHPLLAFGQTIFPDEMRVWLDSR